MLTSVVGGCVCVFVGPYSLLSESFDIYIYICSVIIRLACQMAPFRLSVHVAVAGTPAHSVAYIVDVDSRLPKLDRLIDYTPTAIHNAWYPIKAALNV